MKRSDSATAGIALARLALVGIVATLAACGGGDGSAGDSPADPPPVNPTPVDPPPVDPTPVDPNPPGDPTPPSGTAQTDPGNPSYAASLRAAFDLINAERTAAGLGVVRQSAELDVAAKGHSNYLAINNDLGATHSQITNRAGFTGARAFTRVQLANYSTNFTVEDISPELNSPVEGVRDLLSMPYHRMGLHDHRARDIGLGFVPSGSTLPAGSTSAVGNTILAPLVTVMSYTKTAGFQPMLASARGVSVYPAAGSTVPTMMGSEIPNPVAAELGAWGPGKYPGYTVSLQVPSNSNLVVTSFTLKRVTSTGAKLAVNAKLLDQNDETYLKPNGYKNWAHLVPLAPLSQGSTFEAAFTGTVDGKPLTKTWRFETRNSSFTVSAPRRDASGTRVILDYQSPSGYITVKSWVPNNCGGLYDVGGMATKQSVTLDEAGGVGPEAGCTVTVTVEDRGTGLRDTRTVPMTNLTN
jgi:uncharacterized protein YkwD